MPKNSRRKKRTRQHGAHHDEHYLRAARSVNAAAESTHLDASARRIEAMIIAARTRTLSYVHLLQAVVEARGWRVPVFGDIYLDAQGLACSTDAMWEYPPAFGGADLDDDEWSVPQKPQFSLSLSNAERGGSQMSLRVETAGNWGGCPEHRSVARELVWSSAGVRQFIVLLEKVESSSLPLDPTPYIACLTDGLCCKLADDRAGRLGPLRWRGPWAEEAPDQHSRGANKEGR